MHEKGGAMAAAAVALGFALAAAMLTCAVGELIKIGGKHGWKPSVNYTFWSAHQRFYVGDWLYFVFDKHYYNVLEVTKSNYERCNDGEFVKNVTRGGRDVYNLTEVRSYYFLSGGGYCFGGMKVAIHVRPSLPTPPPAAGDLKSAKNGAASPSPGTKPDRVAFLLLLVSMASVSTNFIFKVL